MTAISHGTATVTNYDTSTSSMVVSKPTVSIGDTIDIFAGGTGAVTMTTPAGFTSVSPAVGDTNVKLYCFRRVIDGSEGSTFTVTPSGSTKGFIACIPTSGVNTTTPEDASNSGNSTSSVTSVAPSLTVATAGAQTLVVGLGRHGFAAARSLSNSDGSDASLLAHGSSSGSGFDYCYGIWIANRDLAAVAASRTLTISTGSENAIAWIIVALKPATPATLKGRITQGYLTAPQALPPLRARITQASLTTPAPSGGKTARIVQASLTAPLPAGSPGKSGISVAQGGNIRRVAIYSAKNGQVV
jgi:hypothetical protein